MAWFDRNPGGNKELEVESKKPAETAQPSSEVVAPVLAAVPKPVPKEEPAPQSVAAGLVGYLYKGSRVSGQLNFQGPARIEGAVEGEIHCQGTLTIAETAEIKAKISGQVVVIRGKVEGNVTAKEKVELVAPSRMIGNIESPRLVIAEGVVFEGGCYMGVAKQKGGVASSNNPSADKTAVAQAPALRAESQN